MTIREIEALEKLEQAATKGPWLAGRMDTESYDINGAGPYKNIYTGPRAEDFPVARGESENCRANAALIAAARNYLPRLLADWRRMREALLQASIFVRCESKEPHAAGTCHPCDVYRLVDAILAETSDEKEPSDDRA